MTEHQYPKAQTRKPPSIKVMKRAILAQITEVTEDDLRVMTRQEIRNFYAELLQGFKGSGKSVGSEVVGDDEEDEQEDQNVGQSEKMDGDLEIDRSGEERKQQSSHLESEINSYCQRIQSVSKIQNQYQSQGQNSDCDGVLINGVLYEKPRELSTDSYALSNRRFALINSPELATIEQKRKAVCSAYSPQVADTIHGLRPQELEETYQRLRQPDRKQISLIHSQIDLEPKDFVVYVNPEPQDKAFQAFEQSISRTRTRAQAKLIAKNTKYQPPEIDFTDQDPISQPQPPTPLKRSQPQQKPKPHTQTSIQTEPLHPFPSLPVPRRQLTIITQTRYLSSSESSEESSQEPNLPHKISPSQLRDASKLDVIDWVASVRRLLGDFEQEYVRLYGDGDLLE